MKNDGRSVWIIGHKNPDTDSICAAISYAYLKNATEDDDYIPKKAGDLNSETEYVLKRFGVKVPETVEDVCTEIRDIEFRKTGGISENVSLKKAWSIMNENDVVMLPIVDSQQFLTGIIVRGDIANSYMDTISNDILSTTKTQFSNIIETIDGNMITGNSHAYLTRGRVIVPSEMKADKGDMFNEDDLIICGDNTKRLMSYLDYMPSCMIITGGNEVDKRVKEKAASIQCVLISTELDTYTVARTINQSLPVKKFMATENLIEFFPTDKIDDVTEKVSKVRHRDFPILDAKHHYIGIFSRRNLLNPKRKRIILVDHNEKSQAVDGIDEAEILEIVDHHRIGSLETLQPIYFRNMPLGCSSTIIYIMYREKNVEIPREIAGIMLSAILSDTLMFRSPTCTEEDKRAAEDLAKIAGEDCEKLAYAMFEAGSNFSAKTPEQVLYQDYKTFYADDISFGVSQVSAVSRKMLDDIKKSLKDYLPTVRAEKNVSMVFVMLTDIFEETTELIYDGDYSSNIVRVAFNDSKDLPEKILLKNVVSRKKQLIPPIIQAVQALDM